MKHPIPDRRESDRDALELVHDFNNLLTAIIGAAEAVLERSGIDPETRSDIAHIHEGARRGAALVGSIRAGSRVRPTAVGLISVNETIRTTSRLLAHRLGARINLDLMLDERDHLVRAEPWQLDRVLLNLVANAHHAMQDGGTVALTTGFRLVMEAEPRVPDTIPPGEYVTIAVADTGHGIPGDELPRIFEAGFTSRRQSGGSGLGLASIREIMRQANGFIAVESVEGRGTRFEIYLPRRTAEAAPIQQPRTAEAIGAALLVEDDPLVRQVAERVLRRAGWTVLCADSAEAALEILRQTPCDLMISDVAMPGMDGLALTRQVLSDQPMMPIILTSGYDRPDTRFGVGTVGFLTKPYGQAELLAAVARVVQPRPNGTES